MRTPRDLDGDRLVKRLREARLPADAAEREPRPADRTSDDGDHHVTVPLHSPLRVGTLNAILGDVAAHLGMSRDDVIRRVS